MAVYKETVDLYAVPYRIRELMKKEGRIDDGRRKAPGYDTFIIRPKAVHAKSCIVEITAYTKHSIAGTLPCPSCDHRPFVNRFQLEQHQRAKHQREEVVTA